MDKYSEWDYYEIEQGFRLYRYKICTGKSEEEREYGDIFPTRTTAYIAALVKNNQEKETNNEKQQFRFAI